MKEVDGGSYKIRDTEEQKLAKAVWQADRPLWPKTCCFTGRRIWFWNSAVKGEYSEWIEIPAIKPAWPRGMATITKTYWTTEKEYVYQKLKKQVQ